MTDRSLAGFIQQACLMEATARKPGNVHPGAAFVDLTFDDFVRSAELVAPFLASAEARGVGTAIFDAVRTTRDVLGRNTNLGIVLLLAPLAAVPSSASLQEGISDVLRGLDLEQTRQIYAAIRLAGPGGMGKVEDGDISDAPKMTLLEAMELARDRDAVATEYATNFALTTTHAARTLAATSHHDWELRVIHIHLWFLARQPDTLIARKCGLDVAEEAQGWARHILAEGWPETDGSVRLFQKFDRWLRADGHRRNPGTTADLVAATLFIVLREQMTTFPDWPPSPSDGSLPA